MEGNSSFHLILTHLVMLFATIINSEGTETVSFVKCTKEQAIESFNGNLQGLVELGEPYTIGLVDEDELTQASLYAVGGEGIVFDSTVVYTRYADSSLGLDETDYMLHA